MENKSEIRIYAACLAAYNNGILHGAWIDAEQTVEDIRAEISSMLAASPMAGAEEYAIHDYEGFGGVRISEYEEIGRVAAIAAFIAEHGNLGAELIVYYGGDLGDATDALDDRYLGKYEGLAHYVQSITEECLSVPESLRFYIDWQRMARDAEMSGEVFTIETAQDEVHVFLAG